MSRLSPKRALNALRRLARRRRVPGPSEQQWLRLILLVRRMQRGQLAVAQRLDDIRALNGAMGSFRSDFGALQEQLTAARISAGELERGLSERLKRLDVLPDPARDQAILQQRVAALDELAARLERLAGQAPTAASLVNEVGPTVERLATLAARMESAAEAQSSTAGQDELAQLYERIEELAAGLVAPVVADSATPPPALDGVLERLETVAVRLEQAPAALPDLPAEAVAGEIVDPRELADLRDSLICEQEARHQLEEDVATLRERLRGSELAKMELETQHSTEMAQMADHVGAQVRRLEDDLKKKKRGLAELTQQNIALQTRLGQVQAELSRLTTEPPPPLPGGGEPG